MPTLHSIVLTLLLLMAPLHLAAHKDHDVAPPSTGTATAAEASPGEDAGEDDWGDEDDWGEDGAVEELVEDLGATGDDDNPATTSALQEFVAYFHAATTHFPIAWFFLIYFLELLCFGGKHEALEEYLYPFWAITFVSFTIPIITGLCRFDMLGFNESQQPDAVLHRNLIFVSAALLLPPLFIRFKNKKRLAGNLAYLHIALLTIALIVMVAGAHLGGEMVYGEAPMW